MAQAQIAGSTQLGSTRPASGAQAMPPVETTGVDGLIHRLRDEGIEEGRNQAQALLVTAQKQASDIVAAARREADSILVKAKEDAGKLKAAGEHAISLAMRDTILSLEDVLVKEFRSTLGRLVKGLLVDPAFLQRLILEIGGMTADASAGKKAELLLSAELVSLDELQRKPEQATPGTLMHFVLSLGGGMLRDGISFGAVAGGEAGIRVRLVDDDMQIDLTEPAISTLLLRHLLPRFRALLRGKVAADDVVARQPDTASVAQSAHAVA